mmetsp:Transcript_34876/g.91283  ORF Transcript_34876/g.91283 Transcript_34876/m.91283 type:complete len:91 (-) Transcript_34876:1127-1399(-)
MAVVEKTAPRSLHTTAAIADSKGGDPVADPNGGRWSTQYDVLRLPGDTASVNCRRSVNGTGGVTGAGVVLGPSHPVCAKLVEPARQMRWH